MEKFCKIIFILSSVFFLFTQCKKTNEPIVTEEPTTIPTPTKNCLITAEIGATGNHIYDYTYNDKYQLVEMIFHTVPDAKDSYRFIYEYNDKGQRTKETSYQRNGSIEIASFTTYEYDVQSRIIKSYHESYYDINGNPNSSKGYTLYEYNEKNQLIKIRPEDQLNYRLYTYNDNEDLIKIEYVYAASGQKELLRTYEYDVTKPAFIVPESWLLFIEDAKYSKHFCKRGYMYNQYGKTSIFNEMAIEKYTAEGFPEIMGMYTNADKSKGDTYTYKYICK